MILRWLPEEDITTFELALCIQVLIDALSNHRDADPEKAYNKLPPEARRHWELMSKDLPKNDQA